MVRPSLYRQAEDVLVEVDRSLDILNRTVMVPMHPNHSDEEIEAIIHNIEVAARVTFGELDPEEARTRRVSAIDTQKFDMKVDA